MSETVLLSREGDIALVTVNNPPVNALSPGVPEGIMAAVGAATADTSIRALILVGSGRTFIAGADIKEFQLMTLGQKEVKVGLYPLMLALEDCPKPVVCAIHGNALGGGLEVALACHYRVALASAKLGQPEVRLGLIPGAGGTQRLPRLAGVARALEMIAFGLPVGAQEAVQIGIVDDLISGDLLPDALAWTRNLLARAGGPRRTRELDSRLGNSEASARLFENARSEMKTRAPGLLAPLKAVEAVEAATRLPFEDGCRREEELFLQCLFSDQSRALIHVFFAERDLARIPENARPAYEDASRRLSRICRDEAKSLIDDGAGIDEIRRTLREFGMLGDWLEVAASDPAAAESRNRGPVERDEILERFLCALVNEGARMLEEGLPARAAHIDILSIRDCGFPRHLGGAMWHADARGLQTVYRRICSFRECHGHRWAPAPLLRQLAGQGQSFADYDAR